MAFETDEVGYIVFRGESFENVGFVLEDSLLDVAGHADVEDASLAGQNVDVVELGHDWRVRIGRGFVSDRCHVLGESVPNRDFRRFVILRGGEAGVRDPTLFDGFDDAGGDRFAVRS